MRGLNTALAAHKKKAKPKAKPAVQQTFDFKPTPVYMHGCLFCGREIKGQFCDDDHEMRYLALINPRKHREIMQSRRVPRRTFVSEMT